MANINWPGLLAWSILDYIMMINGWQFDVKDHRKIFILILKKTGRCTDKNMFQQLGVGSCFSMVNGNCLGADINGGG